MHTQRTHVILPKELIAEIDALVGPRGRSAFLIETARSELKRRHLLAFLNRGKLQYQWAVRGRTLSLIDMIAAATALENSAALITDNRKDFPLHGLHFYTL